jgi:hypothetical protein
MRCFIVTLSNMSAIKKGVHKMEAMNNYRVMRSRFTMASLLTGSSLFVILGLLVSGLFSIDSASAAAERCTAITSITLSGGEGGHVIANTPLTAVPAGTTPATCAPNTPTYVWRYSDSVSMTSSTVVGTNNVSYTPTDSSPNLVGKYVQLTFTFKPNAFNTVTVVSAATIVWPADVVVPFMHPEIPVIFTYVGSTLTATANNVQGSPTPVVTYRWWSCTDNSFALFDALRDTLTTVSLGEETCDVVTGATGDSYTVLGDETGPYFFPEVKATNAYGLSTAYGISIPTIDAPTFTGTTWEGQLLTRGAAPAVTGYPTPAITYKWQTSSNVGVTWSDTAGTALTYRVTAADRSNSTQMQIRILATATSGSQSVSTGSTALNTYTYPNATGGSVTKPAPAARGTYTSGKYDVGQTVIGHPWQVMGTPYPTLDFQWYVCDSPAAAANIVVALAALPIPTCVVASGDGNSGTATKAGGTDTFDVGNYGFSYVVPAEAAGNFLTFTATLTNQATVDSANPFTFTQSRTMNSGRINSAPGTTGTPDITGIKSVGKKLTAATVSYSGTPTGRITYQWMSSDTESGTYSPITNATFTTYTPVIGDLGKYLKVIATATSLSGSTSTATSVTPYLINPAYAIPSGALVSLTSPSSTKGATLSASITPPTSGYPAAFTYTYQWQRCTTATGSCSNIGSATSATYVTTGSDSTKYIRLAIRATNSVGTSAWVYSSNRAGPISR